MRAGIAARTVVVLGLVVASMSPVAPPGVGDASKGGQPPDVVPTLLERLDQLGLQSEPADSDQRKALVVVDLKAGAELPDQPAIDVRKVYTRRGTRHIRGYAALSDIRRLSRDPHITTVRIKGIDDAGGTDGDVGGVGSARQQAPGVRTVRADTLHSRGLDGAGVTVGVIDADFRVDDPEIATNVAAYRSFDDWQTGTGGAGGTPGTHGTAVASVVVDTAPKSTLHLAAIGETTTPEEYERAVEWLEESGVDVIVDAGSYVGQSDDGSASLGRIAASTSNETVFVTSAGNYARRHWVGTHNATTDDRWVDVAPGTEANLLAGGEQIRGRVTARLDWNTATGTNPSANDGGNRKEAGDGSRTTAGDGNRTTAGDGSRTTAGDGNRTTAGDGNRTADVGGKPTEADDNRTADDSGNGTAPPSGEYDLYLFRREFGGDSLVATSTDGAGDATSTYLDVTVPPGKYYLAVRATNATGTNDLSMFANRKLAHRNAADSLLAPATEPTVLAVGAYRGNGVAPFSSRGPVGNRTGVDLVAPDTVAPGVDPGIRGDSGADGGVGVRDSVGAGGGGTSYAAPYVAGTAALLAAEHPNLTAAELRAVLRSSARDVGPVGVDAASGHGLLDAAVAATLARERVGVRGNQTADDRTVNASTS